MTQIEYNNEAKSILQITRERSGKTQKEMAALMGVSRQTINSWECGYTFPVFPDVIKWFHVLNLDGSIINEGCINDCLEDIRALAADIINIVNEERKRTNEK